MNIGDFLTQQNVFDIVFVLALFGAFVIGYVQGAIRRLLAIAAILFSLLLGAQIRAPFGKFLSENWHQFPAEYSYMLAFGIVFVVASVAFSLVIQGLYKRAPLFANANFVDEVIGGLLGVVEGLIIMGAAILILDSYFRLPQALIVEPGGELKFLRDFYNVYDTSGTKMQDELDDDKTVIAKKRPIAELEVKDLKERIKVIERITVEKENSLSKEIEALRDR